MVKERLGGDPHHDIRDNPALAGLAVSQTALVLGKERAVRTLHLPFFQDDAAFAADTLAAAGGVDVHPGSQGGPEEILSFFDLDADIVRLKGDFFPQDMILMAL